MTTLGLSWPGLGRRNSGQAAWPRITTHSHWGINIKLTCHCLSLYHCLSINEYILHLSAHIYIASEQPPFNLFSERVLSEKWFLLTQLHPQVVLELHKWILELLQPCKLFCRNLEQPIYKIEVKVE